MGGGVEVDEHAAHGAALALAAVLAAGGCLGGQSSRLQDEAGPSVGELEAVDLGGLLPEVLDGEVAVALTA